jgi:biopolymer transport protein ExbD
LTPATHYDLWLASSNRAYRAVPYETLADWVQQGRVGPADRVRPVGTEPWSHLGDMPLLAVYLPSGVPRGIEDRAAALEPVELGMSVRGRAEEDDDVDMVPLIDISLVLLIFFIMTTTVAVGGTRIMVPETQFASLSSGSGMLVVSMDLGADGQPVYSFAAGDAAPLPADTGISADEVIDRIRRSLKGREAGRALGVRVAAHHRLPFETVEKFASRLSALRPEGLSDIKAEVQERPK